MSAELDQKNENPRKSIGEILAKNQKVLIVIGVVLLVGAIGGTILGSFSARRADRSYAALEALETVYADWNEAEDKEAARAVLEENLAAVQADFPRSFGAQRALWIRAELAILDDQPLEAAEILETVGSDYPKTYLAPLALFRAGILYEDGERPEKAFELYNKISETYSEEFGLAPRALFAQGRLSEENPEEARGYYRQLAEDYPKSDWADLARSRLMVLEE